MKNKDSQLIYERYLTEQEAGTSDMANMIGTIAAQLKSGEALNFGKFNGQTGQPLDPAAIEIGNQIVELIQSAPAAAPAAPVNPDPAAPAAPAQHPLEARASKLEALGDQMEALGDQMEAAGEAGDTALMQQLKAQMQQLRTQMQQS